MGEFTGFGEETTRFLADLEANNEKAWLDANRDRYEAHWMEPAKAFVEAAGEALAEIAPGVNPQPKVNGSIMRINRDVRFSNDKRPYKDHLDMGIWEGDDKKAAASMFYVRITADSLGLGAGNHSLVKERLTAYRDAVVDGSKGSSLIDAVSTVESAGWELRGEHYKKTPRGYEAEGEAERLLRFNALWIAQDDETPQSLGSPEFVDYCIKGWREMLPVHRWLVDNLQI